jgi:hypothetical protein
MTLRETLFKQSIVELHWALQVVASVGPTYLPAQRNNSHTALFWDARGWIISPNIKPSRSFEVALDIASLQLHFLGHANAPQGKPSSSFSLRGHTLEAAYEWLENELQQYLSHNFEHVKRVSEMPWKLPPHPLNRGSLFSYQESIFKECEQYLESAYAQLNYLHQLYHANAKPVSLWPQNFVLSTLLHEMDREIEVGFSFAEKELSAPHFFIHSSQVPPQKPSLNRGEWQGERIVLPLTTIASETPQVQAQQIAAFLAENTQYLWKLPHQSKDFFK